MESAPRRMAGWWVHLIVLTAYLVVMASLRLFAPEAHAGAMVPTQIDRLLVFFAVEFAFFAAVFGLAVVFSRPTAEDLMLRWTDGWKPVLRGFGYSIVLRIAVGLVLVVIVGLAFRLTGHRVDQLQSQSEMVVDPRALVAHPLYLLVTMTLISFVLAGFREELWRAGMLAALWKVSPALAEGSGRYVAVALVAMLFGFGHLPQGPIVAAMIGLVGFGLGWIMVRRRSIWDAVFTHGFFDAASFYLIAQLAIHRPELLPRS